MIKAPPIGLEHRREVRVGELDSIRLGPDLVAVFSTPAMILLFELAARELLQPFLEPGEETVGMSVEVEHLAPTPLGETVWAIVRLEGMAKGRFDFSAQVMDRSGEIGRGRHRRAVIKAAAFQAGLDRRRGSKEPVPFPAALDGAVGWREERGVVLLSLRRPARYNAIDATMTSELENALDRIEAAADAIRVVVVTGTEGRFCAGEDVRENAGLTLEESIRMAGRRALVCRRFSRLRQPVIVVVDGACLGGGFSLTLHADWIIATPRSTFGFPEIKLGWPPAYGIDALLRRVPAGRAMDLAMRGRSLSAADAKRAGLLHAVAMEDLLQKELQSLLRDLLQLSPVAMAATKARIWGSRGGLLDDDLRADLEAYASCRSGPDAAEGIAAFLEKRAPRFGSRGRRE